MAIDAYLCLDCGKTVPTTAKIVHEQSEHAAVHTNSEETYYNMDHGNSYE